ncbi:MAG TPA: 4-hydroxyphenylacetate 3-hydroxylase N-terminal domain-containing protein, partial [Candidatus Competibacteraceae bacterium]|nr:4-hydroxyphenylacetate 3-hydroxylase N-terminal domain-containing protein [Candidatus Competibacteraceae bacterium]
MLMSGQDYRESLRRYQPRVFINGRQVESVVDEPLLAPGVNGVALTYDFALCEDHAPLMRASRSDFASGQPVNRMIAIPASTDDLLDKLEAVRLVCQETGCAQRYLGGDALSAIQQTTVQMDAELETHYGERFRAYLKQMYAEDLTLGVAMTDGKGDRSRRPSQQANPDAYVQIVERRKDGIVISGVKAIITGAPYMHELLVMPGRNLTEADADYAVCCAVPVDAENLTLVARPAGRPGEPAAKFSARYGQSTAVAMFDQVFVPWERVFLAGEWRHSGELTHQYATHHRHTCIGARAGFGDLLIGAGALMTEANGLDFDHTGHLREAMVELIQITEGF